MHIKIQKFIKWFIAFLAIIFVGAAVITYIEQDISYLNSVYLCMMTTTTVGFGDIVPKTDIGKMFVSFYALFGIGSFLYLFSILENIYI